MQGFAPSQWLEPVEQEPPLSLHSHSEEFHRTSSGNANKFLLNSGLYMRILMAVFTVTVIIFLIARALHCLFPRSRGSSLGLRKRRLASGGGKQGDDDNQERPQVCETLEELLAAQWEEYFASDAPPPQPAGTSVGDAAEVERPQKRKRKTNHHEEDTGETSEQQAKRAREQEWMMDPLEAFESFLSSFEGPTPTSPPAPLFLDEPAEYEDADMLEKLLTMGSTTLEDWLVVSEDDVPLTTEEESRPQGPADLPPLEGTSRAFLYDQSYNQPYYVVEGGDPREPSGDMEMPSTSGVVSSVQPVSSQPPLPHVSQPSQVPHSVSRPEGSAASPEQMTLIPFNQHSTVPSVRADGGLVQRLKPLEELLRKERHSKADMQNIIKWSEKVYELGVGRMSKRCIQREPSQLARVAVNRLLVLDALWRACEAVGPAMMKEVWWNKFAMALYGDATWWESTVSRKTDRRRVYSEIVSALESFSRGVRPEEGKLARLKREVFDEKTGIPFLKSKDWDLWREGDKDS